MSDPRYTDPRASDPRVDPALNDPLSPRVAEPVSRRDRGAGGMWGWVVGFAVLALVAFVVIAGMNNSTDTASNMAPPPLSGQPPSGTVTSPTTTGSGMTSPPPANTVPPAAAPVTPAPSAPAPNTAQ